MNRHTQRPISAFFRRATQTPSEAPLGETPPDSPAAADESVELLISRAETISESSAVTGTESVHILLNENVGNIERDPGKRAPINTIVQSSQRDEMIREYLRLGPFQPILPVYPRDNENRSFKSSWFSKPECADWLEYSPTTNKIYCLCCYLFPQIAIVGGTSQQFISDGFSNWKHAHEKGKGINKHIGTISSSHNKAKKACHDLTNQRQSIDSMLLRQTADEKSNNRKRLKLSISVSKHLSLQGHAFRGNDETVDSLNRGNFHETLAFKIEDTDLLELVMNAPKNAKYTSPIVQKDICHAMATMVQDRIKNDIGDSYFSIIVDECRDVSGVEWLVLIVRWVDGKVNERVLDFVAVPDTSANALLEAIVNSLNRHGLSTSKIRGQSFDGAANMSGRLNGLQAKVRELSKYAFFFHCWAHKLNLVVVEVCESHTDVSTFFYVVQSLHNLISNSPKSKDSLKHATAAEIARQLDAGTETMGSGNHQISSIGSLSKTRWASHYLALVNTTKLFNPVCVVLEEICEGTDTDRRAKASLALKHVRSPEFVFILHLMSKILELTYTLSQSLQVKDQNIINASRLVRMTKQNLNEFLASGFEELLQNTQIFCSSHEIEMPSLDAPKPTLGRPRASGPISYLVYFKVVFEKVIESCIDEMNHRFDEESCHILGLISGFDPSNHFGNYNPTKVLALMDQFGDDFPHKELIAIEVRDFDTFVKDANNAELFGEVSSLEKFTQMLVVHNLKEVFPNIFRLSCIILTLPISTASAERSFSALKIIKTRLRNSIGDKWFVDQLLLYIEKDIVKSFENEQILNRYVEMGPRRGI